MNVRAVLSQAMCETGTTQTRLSAVTGIAQGRISTYVTGRLSPSEKTARLLLGAMGYTLRTTVAAEPVRWGQHAERRSWALHRQIASHLDAQALVRWTPTLRRNLATLRAGTSGRVHLDAVAEWERLVDAQDVRGLREALLDPGEHGVRLREVGPFAGILDEAERAQVLTQVGRA